MNRGDVVESTRSGRVGTVVTVTPTIVQVEWREGTPRRSAVPRGSLEVRESNVHGDQRGSTFGPDAIAEEYRRREGLV